LGKKKKGKKALVDGVPRILSTLRSMRGGGRRKGGESPLSFWPGGAFYRGRPDKGGKEGALGP